MKPVQILKLAIRFEKFAKEESVESSVSKDLEILGKDYHEEYMKASKMVADDQLNTNRYHIVYGKVQQLARMLLEHYNSSSEAYSKNQWLKQYNPSELPPPRTQGPAMGYKFRQDPSRRREYDEWGERRPWYRRWFGIDRPDYGEKGSLLADPKQYTEGRHAQHVLKHFKRTLSQSVSDNQYELEKAFKTGGYEGKHARERLAKKIGLDLKELLDKLGWNEPREDTQESVLKLRDKGRSMLSSLIGKARRGQGLLDDILHQGMDSEVPANMLSDFWLDIRAWAGLN